MAAAMLPCLLLLWLSAASSVSAVKVVVPAGKTECVTQSIGNEGFEVPGGPRMEGAVMVSAKSTHITPSVTIRVHAPSGDQMWSQAAVQQESHFNVGARGPGTYKVCFYNGFESRGDVTIDLIYFHLGHLRRPGTVQVPKGTEETRNKEVANKGHLDQVKVQVTVVSELVDILSGEQRYLQRKLERHIRTVTSNNRRTFWYTSLEVFVLIILTCAQVYTITKFFKGGPMRITV